MNNKEIDIYKLEKKIQILEMELNCKNLERRIQILEKELNCKNIEKRVKNLENELVHIKSAIQYQLKKKKNKS